MVAVAAVVTIDVSAVVVVSIAVTVAVDVAVAVTIAVVVHFLVGLTGSKRDILSLFLSLYLCPSLCINFSQFLSLSLSLVGWLLFLGSKENRRVQ